MAAAGDGSSFNWWPTSGTAGVVPSLVPDANPMYCCLTQYTQFESLRVPSTMQLFS